jgi:threonine/homoserine/homoserine lactone efflux protein
MTFEVWLTFVITASVIIVVPGPTNIYIVGQSLNHGKKASIPLSAGVITGDALCIFLSLLGVSALLSLCSAVFAVIKYCGAAYLIYLGTKMLIENSKIRPQKSLHISYSSKDIFRDVFLVTSLNPKGIIFYSAFMPQFVNPQQNITGQLITLAITFMLLAIINVIVYSLLADKARDYFKSNTFIKAFNLTGGLGLIGAGLYSATVKEE